jgi:hypothetical protein
LTVSGEGGWFAGIDVAAERTAVRLSPRASTRTLDGEIVHLVARSLRDGPVAFRFGITAPLTPGSYRLFGSTVVGNGDAHETGDAVARATYGFTVDEAADDPSPCELAPALQPSMESLEQAAAPASPEGNGMQGTDSHARRRTTAPLLAGVFLLAGVAVIRTVKSDT